MMYQQLQIFSALIVDTTAANGTYYIQIINANVMILLLNVCTITYYLNAATLYKMFYKFLNSKFLFLFHKIDCHRLAITTKKCFLFKTETYS